MFVRLAGDILTITGRENYGFQVRGNWSVSNNDGAETFTAAGAMQLVSKIGDIPFVSPPISILTKTDAVLGYGEVNGPTISFAGMDFKTTAIGALNDVFDKIGLNLTLSGMQFGIATGKTLSSNILKSVGAPLVDSIPYIFFSNFNAPQITYGEIGIGLDNTAGLAVVFDPADPFIYVSGMDPRGDVAAVGISKEGYIPYSPTRKLDKRIGDDMYGNIYARVKAMIPLKPVDLGIDGEMTLDWDYNDDGDSFITKMDKSTFHRFVKGDGQAAGQLHDALSDVAIGLNGKLSVAFGKKGIGIELPVGSAALLAKGDGRVAFSGGSVNPFAGTFLEKFNTAGEVAIDGYISAENFVVSAAMSTSKFGPLQVSGSLKITNRDITADLRTQSPIPNFPEMRVNGFIGFDGQFKITGETGRHANFGPFSTGITLIVSAGRSDAEGYFLYGRLKTHAQMNVVICDPFRVSFDVGGKVAFDDSFVFRFDGRVGVFCDLPWPAPDIDVGIGFSIDNRGFSIPMPGPVPNVRVNF